MAERVRLDVQARTSRGSRATRRLRKQGIVPGVLYGGGREPRAISVDERELRRALSGSHGLHAVLDVVVDRDGGPRPAILKAYQHDRLKGGVTHVDLQEVRLDQPIQTSVAVRLVGDAPGVDAGGVLAQQLTQVGVEALPMEVPDEIVYDVSGMRLEDTIRVGDLTAPRGVTIVDDPESVVASITHATPVVEPEEMQELEETVSGLPPEQTPEGGSEAAAERGGDAVGSQGTVPG